MGTTVMKSTTKSVNALDVAAYILRKQGRKKLPAMKLEKLVYYAQAWSLVWDEKPLFRNRIEAWANGPVVPALYEKHRGQYAVNLIPGADHRKLNKEQRETVEAVLSFYGDRTSQWLSDLTHLEDPWRQTRKGIQDGERGNRVIPTGSLLEYYSSIPRENE